jgi:protein tyrosine phosphatase (PTP) superfamily phosphohydrolase (DUF442 family)
MNFDFITDNMAVGTTPEGAYDVSRLSRAGITHVINCRAESDDIPLLQETFQYLWNGTSDWTPRAALGLEPKPVEWFQNSLAFWVNKFASFEPSKKLFVHCSVGVNRSTTTAWMFLRALQLMANDCDILIDRHRPIATIGTFFDHPWRKDAETALKELGYIRG